MENKDLTEKYGMTVPNLITSIRIILAPIFIIYMINKQFQSAMVVFIICGVSDCLDGMVARIFNQKTRLGAFLDPLADKILLVSAFVALGIVGSLPAWLTVTVIARDIMILLGVFVLFLNHLKFKIKPFILSKITTWFQFGSVIAVLSTDFIIFHEKIYTYLFYLTALFTISSGLHYMHYGFRLMSSHGSGED